MMEFHGNTSLPQKREISNKQSNFKPKGTKKKKNHIHTKTKVSRKKEIIKIKRRDNEIETKTIGKKNQ